MLNKHTTQTFSSQLQRMEDELKAHKEFVAFMFAESQKN